MFLHNYLYRLKCILRDKETMFWTLLFPILLATLFNITMTNITKIESFAGIKIGIVDNEEYRKNTEFIHAMDTVSNSSEGAGTNNLFEINYTSKEEGDQLLEDGKIEGYIYFENGLKLVVKKSGINQTIIKSFLDDFKQTSSTMANIIEKNPAALQNGLLESISNRMDYIKETAAGDKAADTIVIYFYALIAMTCLYGSFLGLKEVTAIQADLSSQGARVNMVPAHKIKLFTASMFAAATVQLTEIFILIGYMILILNVGFGSQLGYIALTCIIGTITGVSFGACIAAAIKKGEGIKIAILIGGTMLMSFLSGMMFHGIKHVVSTKAPVIALLNPVNLITDSLYSLYYYDTYTQFFKNIALLLVFAVAFNVMTYFVVRRQKYASL